MKMLTYLPDLTIYGKLIYKCILQLSSDVIFRGTNNYIQVEDNMRQLHFKKIPARSTFEVLPEVMFLSASVC